MPYDDDGIYTPPAGATDAAAGDIIHSATWNTIFSDLSVALTTLGVGLTPRPKSYVASGNFTAASDAPAYVIQGSSPTITVPLATARPVPFWVLSGSATVFGNAAATLVATSPDTINGQGTLTLNRPNQAVYLEPVSLGWVIGSGAVNPWQQTAQPSTKTSSYTMTSADGVLIFNQAGTSTLTMQSAASFPGRWLHVKTIQSQSVLASATIIQPLIGPAGSLTTTICAATAGKFANLVSDGSNWIIMAGN